MGSTDEYDRFVCREEHQVTHAGKTGCKGREPKDDSADYSAVVLQLFLELPMTGLLLLSFCREAESVGWSFRYWKSGVMSFHKISIWTTSRTYQIWVSRMGTYGRQNDFHCLGVY
eukprot:m.24680 g.24680  ORF g.24680 m.24680 type:complete len:115 (+) comp28669_c0_seq1:1282-1626(+)